MIWKRESSTGVSGMTAGPSRVWANLQSREEALVSEVCGEGAGPICRHPEQDSLPSCPRSRVVSERGTHALTGPL